VRHRLHEGALCWWWCLVVYREWNGRQSREWASEREIVHRSDNVRSRCRIRQGRMVVVRLLMLPLPLPLPLWIVFLVDMAQM
jgi:hypothetical protein